MGLREKAANILILGLVVMAAVLYAASRAILYGDLRVAAVETAQRRVQDSTAVLWDETRHVLALAEAWAEALESGVGEPGAGARAGVSPFLLAACMGPADVDLLVALDAGSSPVFSFHRTPSGGAALAAVPENVLAGVLELVKEPADHGAAVPNRRGFGYLATGPLALAVVRRPAGAGGDGVERLVVGRYLTERRLRSLLGPLLDPVSLISVQRGKGPKNMQILWPGFPGNAPPTARAEEGGYVVGYALIRDLAERPELILQGSATRGAYSRVETRLAVFLLVLLSAGLLCGLGVMVLLELLVFSRLYRLRDEVVALVDRADFDVRIDVRGKDEPAQVSAAVNGLLDTLQESQGALRENQEKYRELIERANDGILIVQDGRVRYLNPRFAEYLGFLPDTIMSTPVSQLVSPEERERVESTHAQLLQQEGPPRIYETVLVKRDGEGVAVEVNAGLILYYGKPAIMAFIRDITDRLRAESALSREKEQLDVILRSITECVIAVDRRGTVVLLNRSAETLTGVVLRDARGLPIQEVADLARPGDTPEPFEPVGSVLAERVPMEAFGEALFRSARDPARTRMVSGTVVPLRDPQSAVIGAVMVLRDVTDTVRTQRELMKIQQLESLGVLAGGIAHDFNNIVTAVLGNVSLAAVLVEPGSQQRDLLDKAQGATMRARDLTQQLLTFSKGGVPIRRIGDIRNLITDSASFMARGSTVRCEFDLAEDLWPANVDEGQISQVINNLVLNAVQAMPEGGTIRIRAGNFVQREPGDLPLAVGNYLKVTLADTGVGIPAANLQRIFEPYFTTKKAGNGLGLSMCYSIIAKHDGYITVESTVGVGTTFTLYLPAVQSRKAEGVRPAPVAPARGHGRVLLVDDEAPVREVAAQILRHSGYEVAEACHGEEALQAYSEAMRTGAAFDVVITDLTIPGGMGGRELIGELRRLHREARVLVSSGYSNDPVMADYRKYGFCGVVVKPYTATELSHAVYEAMQAGQPDGGPA